ncbi:MAG: energy-coupling factor transporter transmembrane component T family protein, partial [Chloroflexota bacterium]
MPLETTNTPQSRPDPTTMRLDPRTRLILALLYAVLIVASHQPLWLLVELGAVALVVVVVGEGKAYLRWLRLVAAMTVSWFAISWLAFDLPTAVSASLRLVTLTSTFFVFFRTTPPEHLGNALVKSGLPYEVAFVLTTSVQFVPVLTRKAQNVLDAQRSRGIPLEPGLSALRHYPALMAPLLIQAFELGDQLAAAMESRGFGRPGRTFRRDYRMRAWDWAIVAVAIGALIAAIIFRTM